MSTAQYEGYSVCLLRLRRVDEKLTFLFAAPLLDGYE